MIFKIQMNKILFYLYLRGYFRICIFILNIVSIFNYNYKKEISFYRYFKKKKKYKKEFLEILFRPKVFIFNLPHDNKKLTKKIYNYEMLYLDNQKTNDGHKNVYQSKDNLNNLKEFHQITKYIEKSVNKNIFNHIQNKKLKLIKMWIVITKNLGNMKKHSHFNADFSGVFYVRVDNNKNYRGGLKIHNVMQNINIYTYSRKRKIFQKSINRKKSFIFRPKKNDLIIFNSYIEHSVINKNSKVIDRISLPFDMVF